MGYKDKKYQKNLKQQMVDKLKSMQAFGESKKAHQLAGTDCDKIFSFSTYETYKKHCAYFCDWMKENHPEVSNLKKAKPYVNDWLQTRVDKNLSAWTVAVENQAMCKLFGIRGDDPDRFQPPRRNRKDITRSRGDAKRDRNFSERNNAELVKFCKGTGGRRAAILKLKKDDLWDRERMKQMVTNLEQNKAALSKDEYSMLCNLRDALDIFPDQTHFIHFRNDKGGKSRFAPIIGPAKNQIIERFQNTLPDKKVWEHISTAADIHGYRGDYATLLYKMYARDLDTLVKNKRVGKGKYSSEVYYCRKDERGKRLDKRAMLKASKALGHNRIDVVANNYVRNL